MTALVLTFHGPISAPATTRLRNAILQANGGGLTNNTRPATLFLLFSSTGGSVEDGLGLYSLLKALPTKVVTVNMSAVASIAVAPFLAGSERYALAHSYFHFHNFAWNYLGPHTQTRMEFDDHTLQLDASRSGLIDILQLETKLAATDFDALQLLDKPVIMRADAAKEKGIVKHIGMPSIPADTPWFNVDY